MAFVKTCFVEQINSPDDAVFISLSV